MAPYVLAQDEQRPVRGEERGGVEPAGVAEGGLLAAGAIGRGEHDLGLDRYAQRARGLGGVWRRTNSSAPFPHTPQDEVR